MDDVYRIISLQYYVTSLDTLETTSSFSPCESSRMFCKYVCTYVS